LLTAPAPGRLRSRSRRTGRITTGKLSKKWGKIMQRRSRVRILALKREPYNKPAVWVGSKVTKPDAPIQKKAPLHMLWKTHVVGDVIVQTCGKAGRVFNKWARRMPNVPCPVPASWTLWPENEEHHEYGYAGKDAWENEQSKRYMQEMDEMFNLGRAYPMSCIKRFSKEKGRLSKSR
jgi:hypothetical protein